MAYGVSNGHVTDMTSRDPQRCCKAVRSAILATAWLLVFLMLQRCKTSRAVASQVGEGGATVTP